MVEEVKEKYHFEMSETNRKTREQFLIQKGKGVWNWMPYWAHYTMKYNKTGKAKVTNAWRWGYSNGVFFDYYDEHGQKQRIIDTPPRQKKQQTETTGE